MFYKCRFKLISILLVSLLLFQCFIVNKAYSSEDEVDMASLAEPDNQQTIQNDNNQNGATENPEDGIESLDILEASDDPSTFNTNRYIVKYKSEKAKDKLHKLLEKNIEKAKPLKDNVFDIITIKNDVESEHFISIVSENMEDGFIEYIQPDYPIILDIPLISSVIKNSQPDLVSGDPDTASIPDTQTESINDESSSLQNNGLHLFPNDPFFEEQWGLFNQKCTLATAGASPGSAGIQAYGMAEPALRREPVPPHILDMLRNIPYFREILEQLPEDEMWEKIIKIMESGRSEDIPREVLDELMHEPFFHEMLYEMRNGARDEKAEDGSIDVSASQAYGIDANVLPAWEISRGEGVIVAVIDTGIDIAHEDLSENIWENALEIPGNGIDDDGNGYIDDANGWNFCDGSSNVFDADNPGEESHGTHIAGIIAAKKDNGKGIAGVAPGAKIMPLKVFKNDTAYTSDIIEAIKYAEAMGASIANCSWGTTTYNRALQETMEESGMLFVCAAGNSGSDNDVNPVYPASFGLENIISAASINPEGQLSVFSNYGLSSVHAAAPGEDIISTVPGDNYMQNSGTSMAAAMVSGEAALLLGAYGDMSAAEMKERIINSCDRLSTLIEKIFAGNKINCGNALNNTSSSEVIYISGDMNMPGSLPIPQYTDTGEFNLYSVPTVEGQFIKVAAGSSHSLALKEDGTVWACGYNSSGQLGDGTTTTRTIPVQVMGLSGVIAIAAGSSHSLALKEDGTMWAWGYNNYGQLGDGTTITRTTPVQVSSLSGAIAIAAGSSHSLALKEDGTVWAWGYNWSGQLGDDTTTTRTTPVQVSGLSGVTAIAAGYSHSLALKEDGTVWACGYNSSGQLGDGTTTTRTTPVQVSGLSGVIAIAAGFSHSLALKQDGTVWAWGDNGCGQLGDGTTTKRKTPIRVSNTSGVTAIAAGFFHSLALKQDGTVWAWGDNYYGQLGNGESAFVIYPKWVFGTPQLDTNNELKYVFKVLNTENLNNKVFRVEYDEDELEVIDLCAFTKARETGTGTPEGTNVTIIQSSPGIIRFQVSLNIPQGKKWSGVVNVITFESKISGQAVINYTIE